MHVLVPFILLAVCELQLTIGDPAGSHWASVLGSTAAAAACSMF